MTSVLFETFFIDSKDKNIGDTASEQKAIGVAYAKAILEYLGVEDKPKTTKPKAQASTVKDESFKVKVTTDILNVRAGAGVNFNITTKVKKGDVYTIVETKNGWGKLKSGSGWINLSYTQRL